MVNPDADATTEPASPHVSRSDGDDWFGHPRQLARLFSTEAMERFGYYGMRALLTLYLTQHFLFSDQTTNGLYGGFTALVYLTPLIGGLLADRYLGSKKSVKFGAILMSIAYATLCFGGPTAKPYATVDGTRYEVVIDASKQQYVVDGARKLAIKGQEDGSVNLVAPDGKVERSIAKGGFKSDADRSPFYTGLMLVALALLTIGNGFFKPNISTIVGALYEQGDRRRDAGFTIFYMGINLGSLFSQILCPFLAVALGWWAGFGLAAIGMMISWALIQFAGDKLAGYGDPPPGQIKDRSIFIYIGALAAVPIGWFLFTNLMASQPPAEGSGIVGYLLALPIMGKILFATFLASVILIPIWAWKAGNKVEFQMMVAAIVLIVFNVVFWTLFEQAGSSLTLFADRNTDLTVVNAFYLSTGWRMAIALVLVALGGLTIYGLIGVINAPSSSMTVAKLLFLGASLVVVLALLYWVFRAFGGGVVGPFSMTAGQTQFFNAFFIVVLAPLTSIMWNALGRRGIEPSIPIKFAIALAGVGLGFLALVWGTAYAGADFKVALWWLALLYLIHSMAELCISPVGLSMITKLSIARVVGLMMGLWFLSISCAQYVAGIIAQFASVETVGGQVTNLKVSLDTYAGVFELIGYWSIGAGALLLVLSLLIKKWMHGVQ